ncbi:MAG: RNA recognition motif domain-containing protein [Anaerolineae bacterium]
MSKKLYAGNLSYGTTEDELHALFSEVGTVTSVAIIIDRETGRSKGFGFVEMATEEAAQAAIQRLHNRALGQRTITVTEARPRERTYPAGPYRPGEPAGRSDSAGQDSRGAYYRSDDRGSRPSSPQPDGAGRPSQGRDAPTYTRQDDYPPRPAYNRDDDPGRSAAPRDDRAPRGGGGRDSGDKDGPRDDSRGNRRGAPRTSEGRNRTSPSFEEEWYGDKNTTSRNDRRNRHVHDDDEDMTLGDGSRRRKF